MLVKIIAGTYGYRDEKGHLRPKGAGEVVNVDEAEAQRLVGFGIAEASDLPLSEPVDDEAVDYTPNGVEGQEEAGIGVEDMSFERLKDAADQMGINTAKLRSKKALIDAITKASVELPEA